MDPPSGLPELHRHLDGSLRAATVVDLSGAAVPDDLAFTPGMGLAGALKRFEFTLSLLQAPDAVRRVAGEMCEDAVIEGISALEVRFAPQLHRGAATEEIVDAALDGLAGRAGLILCAIFGDTPGLVMRLVEIAAARGCVGVDLAGGPTPDDAFGMVDYGDAFARARDLGLGRTVHAGEGRPAAEIRTAIERLHAQRIGHGTTLLDDPSVLDLVLDRGVTIEACPTSNWHTGAIEDIASHPLPRWLRHGVKVCVNTDNPLLSAVTLPEELARVASRCQVGRDDLERMRLAGHAAVFPHHR